MSSPYVQLARGPHTVFLSREVVSISDEERLRFDHWNDSYNSSETSLPIDLSMNLTVEAIFIKQYKVTVTSAFSSDVNSTWYDEGATFALLAPSPQRLTGILGILGAKLVFDGWDDNGHFIAPTSNFSLTFHEPHSIHVMGSVDYTTPEVLVSISVALTAALFVLVLLLRRRDKRN